jgi:hypothetical protein
MFFMGRYIKQMLLEEYDCMHFSSVSGFGGLVVSMVPKIAGSNPAEAVGFFGRKNPQHSFLRKGSKAVCPVSQIFGT